MKSGSNPWCYRVIFVGVDVFHRFLDDEYQKPALLGGQMH